MPVRIASIVEGAGEVEALPILIRRILQSEDENLWADVTLPNRQPRHRLIKSGELERLIQGARNEVKRSQIPSGRGAILVVLDSDDDLPCQLGPQLLQRAVSAAGDLPVSVTLAHREWECWYIGAAQSIAGQRGLRTDLRAPAGPEEIRGAKEWLSKRITGNRPYTPAIDQAKLAHAFSLEEAMVCPSFGRFRREVLRLVHQAQQGWPE